MKQSLKAPFPWFGGKSKVAGIVWDRFGEPDNYVEPFFGSGAVLLGSPRIHKYETVNDADGFVCNFWRAIGHDPEAVAHYADQPVYENDLHARHAYLNPRRKELVSRLEGDPEFFDAKIAGWWVWGQSIWIAGGWCAANGPWKSVDGVLVNVHRNENGVWRKRQALGSAGRGVNRTRPNLYRGCGVLAEGEGLRGWFTALSARLRHVRVCCGDWSRILGPTPTTNLGTTAVFLDPPYSHSVDRATNCYAVELPCTKAIEAWCKEHTDDPDMRIALCGYQGEYDLPGWDCFLWKTQGGYSRNDSQAVVNASRETIWFSPRCLRAGEGRQGMLF